MGLPTDAARRLLDEPDPEAAWQLFLGSYLGTIDRAVRRSTADEEEAREIAAEVAARIHADWPALLERYRASRAGAPAGLRVWLAVVARNLAIDVVRARRGRFTVPRPIARLAPWKRTLWQAIHREERDLADVTRELGRPADEVAAALQEIEDALAPGARARRRARVGPALGRGPDRRPGGRGGPAAVPEPAADPAERPEEAAEGRRVKGLVSGILRDLDPDERAFLRIYFLQGATAGEVAGLVGAAGPGQVYDRARALVRRLRRAFEQCGLEPADMERLTDLDWNAPLDQEEDA